MAFDPARDERVGGFDLLAGLARRFDREPRERGADALVLEFRGNLGPGEHGRTVVVAVFGVPDQFAVDPRFVAALVGRVGDVDGEALLHGHGSSFGWAGALAGARFEPVEYPFGRVLTRLVDDEGADAARGELGAE
ncbi:hypothetical protein QWI33_19900 [Glycomyces tritici]|uniref:Uncharacterized protein n=1 Tax=Glycomyces tritici TaxID=2665176 RepID=A0ABT7YTT4_9ACTN|nr:hypothetical protein [Glycomyces tritici]MDN3241995.1 hypothetical protein [Glycomyces tritici]